MTDNVNQFPTNPEAAQEEPKRNIYVALLAFQKIIPMEGHMTLAANSKEEAEAMIIKAYGPHSKIAVIDIYDANDAPGILEALQNIPHPQEIN